MTTLHIVHIRPVLPCLQVVRSYLHIVNSSGKEEKNTAKLITVQEIGPKTACRKMTLL